MNWRLGLGIGTQSIGWAALSLAQEPCRRRPVRLECAGVRIFSDGRDPKDRQSNAVARRLARQDRRMRDRYLKRRGRFMNALIRHGLMPEDSDARKQLERLDPWVLRLRGLDEGLTMHEFGRALFHLQQRRGFRSNRRTARKAVEETGKIKSAATALRQKMDESGARTPGEFLARRRLRNGRADHHAAANHPVRVRLIGTGARAAYNFYPTRELVEEEFHALWNAQRRCHGDLLTDAARDELHDILFFQRKLKPQPVVRCVLNPSEKRAPRALPSMQRLRIYREVNHLRIQMPGRAARKLTRAERDTLVHRALHVRKLNFATAHNLLHMPPGSKFILQGASRKHLDGDQTAAALAARGSWGPGWRRLSASEQEQIVEKLLAEQNESKLRDWLIGQYGLSSDTADAVMAAHLPEGHALLGRNTAARVLKELEPEVVTYDRAVREAGFDERSPLDFDGEVLDKLPYYGEVLQTHVAYGSGDPSDNPEKRHGRLGNPTVHVALNQLRRLVNELIDRFGRPDEIVVELARDLPLSARGKAKLNRMDRQNRAANDRRRDTLRELGVADTYENRLRLRLWEELNPGNPSDRRCPYTGEQISRNRVFSGDVKIGHILPFSRTLDNGVANKTLSLGQAIRFKGRRTPYEAFAASPAGYDWQAIAARAAAMPGSKSWRFAPDAMQRFGDEERDFLDRQLDDPRYLSRIFRRYLMHTGADVRVTPGRLTSDLRRALGLDSVLKRDDRDQAAGAAKNRLDHRRHAVDAVVVGLTDRALLNRVATLAGKAGEPLDDRPLAGLPTPWPRFRASVRECIESIVVSHKPDHGTQGAFHNDTAYGVVHAPDELGRSKVVHRVPLSRLRPGQIDSIRDPVIRDRLSAAATGLTGAAFTRELIDAGETLDPPVRRVRICETMRVIPTVIDADGRVLKAYKGNANYCYDIFREDGGQWGGRVVSRFQANRGEFNPDDRETPDGTPLLMRLRVNDMIATGRGGERRILRIVKLSRGQVTLADHFEAGSLKSRHTDRNDPFRYLLASPGRLQALNARAVHVTASGRLFDPGPPA